MTKRNCKICGKEFEPTTYNNYYCSEECVKEQRRRMFHERYMADTKELLSVVRTRTCAMCGATFVPKTLKQRVCSKECAIDRKVFKQRKRNEKRREEQKK